jgi:membrane protein DedA with SNARE-associated domain
MLDWIINTISSLGYVGIALLMLLENIFPPIPSEVIMPLAGFTVQQGKLTLPLVILAGTIGSVLGALFNSWHFSLGGTAWLCRFRIGSKLPVSQTVS